MGAVVTKLKIMKQNQFFCKIYIMKNISNVKEVINFLD